ncbi:MAG: cupin domain-containing protein [bacterium]
MKFSMFVLIITVVMTLVGQGGSVHSQNGPADIKLADPLPLTRIYSDSMGASHFADMEIPFTLRDYAPPAPPISVTEFFGSTGWVVISSPGGWYGDWHPVPSRQYMICLAGSLEVQVSDGETRRFGPGSVLLVEDTSGKGHVSRVIGNERGQMVALPIVDVKR